MRQREDDLCLEPDRPSGWREDDFQRFIEQQPWTFARTMPRNPHEYTLRRQARKGEFDAAVRYIRENGLVEDFDGRPYKMLYFREHKYWTMGARLSETVLINRKLATQA